MAAGFSMGFLMAGFCGVCLAEPYSRSVRSITGGNGLFTDPAVIRFFGWIYLAVGVILLGVHLLWRLT